MTADAKAGLPVQVTFTSLGGLPLPATIDSFAVDLRERAKEPCRIRLTMDYEVFERAVQDQAFNLLPGVLIGDGVSALVPGRPVVVDARLRDPAVRAFVSRHGRLDSLPVEVGTDADVLRADSWLALTIVQAVQLPAGVGEGAHASVGCETRWNRMPSAGEEAGTIAAAARDTLAELGFQVTRVDDQLCRTVVERNGHRWAVLVHGDEAERTCVCWSVYSHLAEPDKRAAVGAFLLEANYELSVGGFEMDPSDGEIRFRTGIDVGPGPLDAELFRRLVARNVSGMGRAIALLDAFFA